MRAAAPIASVGCARGGDRCRSVWLLLLLLLLGTWRKHEKILGPPSETIKIFMLVFY